MSLILGSILIGVFGCILGIWKFLSFQKKKSLYIKVGAEITGRLGTNSNREYAVIRYGVGDGDYYESKVIGGKYERFYVGNKLVIYYHPIAPDILFRYSFMKQVVYPLGIAVAGVFLALLPLIV